MTSTTTVHPVDEVPAAPKLFALGLQHVLVMYAGAIAVPLIVGRALELSPAGVAFLISADLFVCGVVTILQAFGATPWFGIRLPVMMGVTFAAVSPMVAIAAANPAVDGARKLFGSVMAAGVVAMLIAPLIVAISLGIGMIPLVAPDFNQWMPAVLHPLIESGILLVTFSAVALNAFLNDTADDPHVVRRAAAPSDH